MRLALLIKLRLQLLRSRHRSIALLLGRVAPGSRPRGLVGVILQRPNARTYLGRCSLGCRLLHRHVHRARKQHRRVRRLVLPGHLPREPTPLLLAHRLSVVGSSLEQPPQCCRVPHVDRVEQVATLGTVSGDLPRDVAKGGVPGGQLGAQVAPSIVRAHPLAQRL
eukprot:scaffold32106_cov146-Isochrysis_galbana.AAC.2